MPPVHVTEEILTLPTHLPAVADPNPMFLEHRVYQGSRGTVYPLPFIDRIEETASPHDWKAVIIENEHLHVILLPELGGRIHAARDKSNDYDFIYRQEVIKPALVGLAGPWISGGIEFNWPQHHRPATFMPCDHHIEHEADGAVTVWMGDHDPLTRMKGMHGVRLRPGSACLELRVRAHNRTPLRQTFLWWANAAVKVHAGYQSFFPGDVSHVADHARRATSRFPLCEGSYYGINYAERAKTGVPEHEIPRHFRPRPPAGHTQAPAPNDLSWYANIPVPTSYMAMGSKEDFFGGYDHDLEAGMVHVADHRIAPGKKQWTWGNQEFGYAWDRNLTEPDSSGLHAPYIELMAGVFTDNQPDFSFLEAGETREWSQVWYPIQKIGPACAANTQAALALTLSGTKVMVGACVTVDLPGARLSLFNGLTRIWECTRDLSPGDPLQAKVELEEAPLAESLRLELRDRTGHTILAHQSTSCPPLSEETLKTQTATEPPLPEEIAGNDELYLTGLHLWQYRHATRCPAPYWREALKRDPGDSRCLTMLGRWQLEGLELQESASNLRAALARQTKRNANPESGETLSLLGHVLCLLALGQECSDPKLAAALRTEADTCYGKALWLQAHAAQARLGLARLQCLHGSYEQALASLEQCLRQDPGLLAARGLMILVLRRLDRPVEAQTLIRTLRNFDPLDAWARALSGEGAAPDTQTRLDLAIECLHAGLHREALALLEPCDGLSRDPRCLGSYPIVCYMRAWAHSLGGGHTAALGELERARSCDTTHAFPSRAEEAAALENALRLTPDDASAHLLLGHLLYDRRNHRRAIEHWRLAAKFKPDNGVAWRCLGLGLFNEQGQAREARTAFLKAHKAQPHDARILHELDQLEKRLGLRPAARLRRLSRRKELVARRDDLSVEFCALLNLQGKHHKALQLLESRHFQPWEGGEGQALRQYQEACVNLGHGLLLRGRAKPAREALLKALTPPLSLGEAAHPLANLAELHFWLGETELACGNRSQATRAWTAAAQTRGDFADMKACAHSELSIFAALASFRLGEGQKARQHLREIRAHAEQLMNSEARIDYFATSLPSLLLFKDDLQARQRRQAWLMQAQCLQVLGQKGEADALLQSILEEDPALSRAQALLRHPLPSLAS